MGLTNRQLLAQTRLPNSALLQKVKVVSQGDSRDLHWSKLFKKTEAAIEQRVDETDR